MIQVNPDPNADEPRFQSPTAVVVMLLLWLAFGIGTCGLLIWSAM